MEKKNQAIILAGGLGTRLKSLTGDSPKVMSLVAGHPFIRYPIELLRNSGISSVVICVGYKGTAVETYLGDGSRWGVRLTYSYDTEPHSNNTIGTGAAIRKTLSSMEESFIVMNGDTIASLDINELKAKHLHYQASATIGVFQNANMFWRSNIEFDGALVLNYSKACQGTNLDYVDSGVGYYNKSVFDNLSEYQHLSDIISMLSISRKLYGLQLKDRFYEINTPESLQETESFLEARQ